MGDRRPLHEFRGDLEFVAIDLGVAVKTGSAGSDGPGDDDAVRFRLMGGHGVLLFAVV